MEKLQGSKGHKFTPANTCILQVHSPGFALQMYKTLLLSAKELFNTSQERGVILICVSHFDSQSGEKVRYK